MGGTGSPSAGLSACARRRPARTTTGALLGQRSEQVVQRILCPVVGTPVGRQLVRPALDPLERGLDKSVELTTGVGEGGEEFRVLGAGRLGGRAACLAHDLCRRSLCTLDRLLRPPLGSGQ